jgi:hypothetical protein
MQQSNVEMQATKRIPAEFGIRNLITVVTNSNRVSSSPHHHILFIKVLSISSEFSNYSIRFALNANTVNAFLIVLCALQPDFIRFPSTSITLTILGKG